jgi:hypothetical protein
MKRDRRPRAEKDRMKIRVLVPNRYRQNSKRRQGMDAMRNGMRVRTWRKKVIAEGPATGEGWGYLHFYLRDGVIELVAG